MTIVTTIPISPFEDFRDTINALLADVAVLKSNTGAPTPAKTVNGASLLGFGLSNQQLEYYGVSPFLDKSKSGSTWQRPGGGQAPALNSNGYPIAIPEGVTRLEQIIGVQHLNGPSGVPQRYVWESTKTDGAFDFAPVQDLVDNGVVNGKRQYEFSIGDNIFGSPAGYFIYVSCTSLPTPYSDSPVNFDYNTCVRKDQVALFKSGEVFDPAFLTRFSFVDTLRFMDWLPANRVNVFNWDQRPKPSWASWTGERGVPLEVCVSLINKTGKNAHLHIPATCTADYAVQFATYLKNNLRPDVLKGVEFSNETWNFGFAQAAYLYTDEPPKAGQLPAVPGQHGSPNNRQSGYLSTLRIGAMAKALGFPETFRPILATQAVNVEVTRGLVEGANQAFAEWIDPQHPNYDPALAARYKEVGQLYTGGCAITSYNDGGIFNNQLSDADKATVEGWAEASDNSGLDAAIDQIWDGGGLSSTYSGAYSDIEATLGDNVAYIQSLGMQVITYEGNISLSIDEFGRWVGRTDPKYAVVKEFVDRLYAYQPMRTLFLNGLRKYRTLGVTTNTILADLGTGAYGTLTDAFGGTTTQRGRAMQDFELSPGPAKALTIAPLRDDVVSKGDTITKRVYASGGFGRVTVTATGLVGGVAVDFRTIGGTTTEETGQPVIVTVTAKDESVPPQVVERTFTQSVGPARVYPSGRYMRVLVQEVASPANRVYYCALDAIGIGTTVATSTVYGSWTGSGQDATPSGNLNADDGADWTSNFMGNEPTDLRGDFETSRTVSRIVMRANNPNLAPAKFKVWLSDTPFATDGSGGTLVLDVNEPGLENWIGLPGNRRVFLLGA